MRIFSDFDKTVIKQIRKSCGDNGLFRVQDVIAALLPKDYSARIFVDENAGISSEGIKQFRLLITYENRFRDKITLRVQHDLYLFFDLFEFLEREGFISVFSAANFTEVNINNVKESETTSKVIIFNDQKRYALFDKFFYHFNANEALNDLVEHKFIVKEDRHNTLSRKISYCSLVIAIIALVISAYNGCNRNLKPNTLILDSTSRKEFIQELKSSLGQVQDYPKKISDTVKIHDTIVKKNIKKYK